MWSPKHVLDLPSSQGSVLVPKWILEHSWHLEKKHSRGRLWFQGEGDVIKLQYLTAYYTFKNISHQVFSPPVAKRGEAHKEIVSRIDFHVPQMWFSNLSWPLKYGEINRGQGKSVQCSRTAWSKAWDQRGALFVNGDRSITDLTGSPSTGQMPGQSPNC